ncbi:hypothetical protein SARC_01999 [Sphaeroforma arctica JP610]|uniref:Uncharacterized protein n=1 Tax=Sphaeroforma arctica JP610 TaxID=667725 RepID=A0A0L0G9Y5_9EUKA|nr:hypothetical protein SARC_01999 [Sphaeroforma arctica JP610]KNC85815.1 hypothetical protein SARC_01999 [Sphaeroforma arctica JP610]|eukprot:XP_014159717.1 hypothetical protein SARC_01999 [Sphaeroforma arctica JP610]
MSLETGGRQSEKKGASENFRHGDRNSDILSVQSSTTESTNVREHDSSFPISAPDSDSDTPKSATSGETSTRASSSVGIVFTIKEVYNTRTMTGKQWNHISDWSFLLNLILNGGLFGLIFLVAEKNTSLPEEKNWTIYGTLLGLLIACFEVLLTLGFNMITFKAEMKASFVLVPAFLTFGYISIMAIELFGLVALVTVTGLKLEDELDSRQIFEYDWCRVGGTATGQNISLTTGSGPLPTTFAITGPQAICYTAPTDRPVSSRSRE